MTRIQDFAWYGNPERLRVPKMALVIFEASGYHVAPTEVVFMIEKIGLVAAIVLPLWNIPLIARIIKRKSSRDISLHWAFGVWISMLFMTPSGLQSTDVVWKAFSVLNVAFFSLVVFFVVLYRRNP